MYVIKSERFKKMQAEEPRKVKKLVKKGILGEFMDYLNPVEIAGSKYVVRRATAKSTPPDNRTNG